MCPHRGCFSSYQVVDDGIFLMRNNVSCKIVGVGSIKIKIFNGIIRTLTHVRYVTKLKKKLIYLGVLNFGGYKLTSQDGALKVSKGALVIMKATKT